MFECADGVRLGIQTPSGLHDQSMPFDRQDRAHGAQHMQLTLAVGASTHGNRIVMNVLDGRFMFRRSLQGCEVKTKRLRQGPDNRECRIGCAAFDCRQH